MVMSKSSYEEFRLKRLEENKKRMEALKLPLLSQALRNTPSLKPSPIKRMKPRTAHKQMVVVRRSSRVANKPPPVYSEIPRRIFRSRDLSNRVYASDKARADAIAQAEKLESQLESHYPVFIKSMLQSHVTGGCLGLPGYFCRDNLPKRDEVITLIDEDGDEFPTTYLARKTGKTGLSAGWRGFAVAHGLVDGDALIFQLIQRTAFKVYIIRVNGSKQRKNLSSSEC